jgi:hypothetical protein
MFLLPGTIITLALGKGGYYPVFGILPTTLIFIYSLQAILIGTPPRASAIIAVLCRKAVKRRRRACSSFPPLETGPPGRR